MTFSIVFIFSPSKFLGMAKFNLKTLGLILLVSLPISSFAQSKGVQRFQIGYYFPMTKAVYTERALTQTGLDDDEVSNTVRTKGGFGITLGHFFPVAKIGQKSSLNISLDFLYNLMVWDAKMIGESEYDYTTGEYSTGDDLGISAATVHWGLPVGVDFKTGGEAILDRGSRLSLTMGTGIYPSMNVTAFESNAGIKMKIQPYLKAEVGMFAGINWKVRALYAFGKLDYINFSTTSSGVGYAYESTASLVSMSTFTLSLMVMPGSFKWGRNEWWN